jgi:amino acid adenylation domain-containing protein
VQVVAAEQRLSIEQSELSGMGEEESERRVKQMAREEAQRPFDLERGPMLRVRLAKVGEQEYVLVIVMHHIVSDGWSMGVVIRELGEMYEGEVKGEGVEDKELGIQYADYAVWQREWLRGEELERQVGYWVEQMEGASGRLDLPTDHPRPAVQTFNGAAQTTLLPASLRDSLKDLSQRESCTLFMTLLAAFDVFLFHYTRQRDILVGSPIANRKWTETESLIGFFANMLVLRSRLSGEMTYRELLAQVRQVAFESYANQDLPFEQLVEELKPERDLSRSPMFQVVLSLQNAPLEIIKLPDLTLSRFDLESGTAKYDVVLNMWETDQGLHCMLEYNADLFEADTVNQMLRHFQALLEGIIENPDERISKLQLLTPAERARLLYESNDTRADYPGSSCMHELFEAQVERTPQATALVFNDAQVSYKDLNSRANQLARHLRSLGISSGSRVGICIEHSPETMIGILGTLKAGAAYVPLDPTHPASRLAFMIADAGVEVLLTQSELKVRLPEDVKNIISLSMDSESLAAYGDENLTGSSGSDDLAYVIYTSGSTGKPKGVKIQHRALVNYIWWAKDAYLQSESLAFPLYSSLAFDLTVTSIYLPLITGNSLHIYAREGPEPPLLKLLSDNRAGVLKLTPSHLSLIADRNNKGSRIKRLVVGGEALETKLARRIYESFGGGVEIYNEYGPTEATVGCMIYRFDPDKDHRSFVPIGRPAANVRIYVLGEDLSPVSVNITGDLYVGGDGLAQGYLNRDDLTAEKFLNDPFVPGERIYKTGDLARWLSNGEMEFLGRKDDQIKFHGYRVELNEIRSALNQHPQIRDSVIVLRKDKNGNDVMVAYYVSRQELDAATLCAFLLDIIIEETIPNLFVHLKKLPLTLNGKINYEALPTLDGAREQLKREYVAPGNAREELLAGIFANVLGVEKIGTYDNFFELGGHSLLVTQVIWQLREALQIELPLRTLFEAPTVASLAEKIETLTRSNQATEPPPITPAPRDREIPLSFAQQRLWFLDQLEPNSAAYNVAAAVRLSGHLNIPALESSINRIIRRHEVLRTTFKSVDGRPVQVVAAEQRLSIEQSELSGMGEEESERRVKQMAREEAQRPFDLERGPMLRVRLAKVGEREHVVMIVMHHIVSDGWSMGVVIRELGEMYEREVKGEGEERPLKELEIQYADYAVWQREWLRGEELERQVGYWVKQMEGASGRLELPTDHPRPDVQTYRGSREPFSVPLSLTHSLKEKCRQEEVTLYMLLLAALNVLLHHITGQDDILVGSNIASRSRAETKLLIGFFANMLVLRTRLSGELTFSELLAQVRETALDGYAHQETPFDKLVERLQPERDKSRAPLIQVVFNFQSEPTPALNLADLTLTWLEVDNETEKFDLTLSMEDSEQGLIGSLQYNTDLFNAMRIGNLLSLFSLILENVASDTNVRLDALRSIFAEADKQHQASRLKDFKEARRKMLKRFQQDVYVEQN